MTEKEEDIETEKEEMREKEKKDLRERERKRKKERKKICLHKTGRGKSLVTFNVYLRLKPEAKKMFLKMKNVTQAYGEIITVSNLN